MALYRDNIIYALAGWFRRRVWKPDKRSLLYPRRTVPRTVRDITDEIGVAILCSPTREFPTSIIDGRPYYNFDGIFFSIQLGLENLRKRFGEGKADQLIEMLEQAKTHHEKGWQLTGGKSPPEKWRERDDASSKWPGWWQRRIGNALLQDMQMVIRGRQPWAYPKELYRWPIDETLPELSEKDLRKKDFDEDYE